MNYRWELCPILYYLATEYLKPYTVDARSYTHDYWRVPDYIVELLLICSPGSWIRLIASWVQKRRFPPYLMNAEVYQNPGDQ